MVDRRLVLSRPRKPITSLIASARGTPSIREMAGKEAARAAPYVHPRIGYDSGEGTGDPEFVPLAERLAAYARRDELTAAGGGNVIELKPPGEQ